MKNRRDFLKVAASSLVATRVMGAQTQSAVANVAETEFTQLYDVDRSMTDLENAYWNIMSRPVMEEYSRKVTYVNRRNVPFVRGIMAQESLPVELSCLRRSTASIELEVPFPKVVPIA
jgi:isopenicillin-N epimerase